MLVDDGSPDRTLEVAKSLAALDTRIRVLGFSRNFGKEAAMLAGLRAAGGDRVVIMDADLQHPPELITDMWSAMDATGADQVIARRTRTGDPWLRTKLSRLYYRMVNVLVDVEMVDGAGDFRLLSRRAVLALLDLPEANRFSKGLYAWVGFRTEVVDYHNAVRQAGATSWSFSSLFNYGLDGIISFNDRPLRVAAWAGMSATGLGLIYLLGLFLAWLSNGVEAPGYFTTIAVVVLFGGVQLLTLGVMGEYIGRIYSEVKRRPHFIIATDTGNSVTQGAPVTSVPAEETTPVGRTAFENDDPR